MNAHSPDRSLVATAVTLAVGLPVLLIALLISCSKESPPPVARDDGRSGVVIEQAANQQFMPIADPDGRMIHVTNGAVAGYVDDAECAVCHSAISHTFAHMGMGKSAYLPDVDNLIEDFDNNHFYHAPSQRHYEMVIRDGDIFQRRYQLDEHNQPYNEIERKIDFIIGSGHHSRTYAYRTEAGELFQLPVVWYTQTQSWGMAPGYDRARHFGITRPITRECMFCHNGYPEVTIGNDEQLRRDVFPETLPNGIGCQRCHGPGSAHVRLAYDINSSDEALRDSIVNPVRLSPRLRDDVCLQCHAQPASEVTTRVTHPSRTIYSYRPGEPLSEYLTVLDFDAPNWHGGEDRFDINHHPYRLYQSRCHLRSENGLNCLTCHDPHRRIEPVERASWYRGKCLECHVIDDCNLTAMQIASGNTTLETTDCTVCHMPQRRTQDVIQITMTDHLIQRTPAPEAQRLAARTEHGPPESLTFHLWQPNESMDPRELEMLQGIAYSADGRAEAADHFAQTGKILETMPVEAQYYNAYAQGLAERLGPGISTAERILAVDPDIARVHNLLAQYASASQDTAKALQHSERAVALDPEAARYHFGLGLVRYMRGQVLPAIESFERTIELQPHHVGALANLGHAYRTAGRNDDALATYLRVLAVEPASLDIYIDVAYLYLDDGDGDNAELWIRRGSTLDRAGNIFDAALAVAMIVQQRFDDALLAAEDGRAKGADEGTLRMVQAIAYHALGQDRQVQIALAQLRATADGRVGEQAQLLRRVLEPLLPSSGQ